MKALSIRQPWAFAILHLGKRVEKRSWYTPFRGTFAIHAAKKWGRDEQADLECFREEIVRRFAPAIPTVHLGCLIGTARLVDCIRPEQVMDDQQSWVTGDWCFILDDVRVWEETIKYTGALGLFEIDVRMSARQSEEKQPG